jgi:hypothetical protein
VTRNTTGDLARHPRPPGLLIRGLGGLQRSLRRRRRRRLVWGGLNVAEGRQRSEGGVSELQMASSCGGQDRPGGAAVKFVVIHVAAAASAHHRAHTAGRGGGRGGGDQWCLVRAGVSIVKLWSDFKDYFQGITSRSGGISGGGSRATKQRTGGEGGGSGTHEICHWGPMVESAR